MANLLITTDEPPKLIFSKSEKEGDCEPVIKVCGGSEANHCYLSLSGSGSICIRTTCSPQVTVTDMENNGSGTYCDNCDEEVGVFDLAWVDACIATAGVDSNCLEPDGWDPEYTIDVRLTLSREVVDASTDKITAVVDLEWKYPTGSLYGRSLYWRGDVITGLANDQDHCKDLDGDFPLTWDENGDYGPCLLTDHSTNPPTPVATVTAKFG